MFYIKSAIVAPVSGKCVPLDSVYKTMDGGKMDGGFAIVPSENTVAAPFDAIVTGVSAEQRCVVLTGINSDYEIMVSASFVNAASSGDFRLAVKAGQKVSKGDTLFELDLDHSKSYAGYVSIPCVVSNLNCMEHVMLNYGDAVRGETEVLTSAC